MRVITSKSKNSESFYISQGYVNNKGKPTSRLYKKLGTLKELSERLGTDRDGVMAWAKEQARIETEKYKDEKASQELSITFHANKEIGYNNTVKYDGGYLFLQSLYYKLKLDYVCRRIRDKYNFKYDINAILSDLIYARILYPCSKLSSYAVANKFLEKPTYKLHDVYRALSVLATESDFIQAETFKNSHFLGKRNDGVLYYDCTNYYFEIEQEDGSKKYGKSKEHRPNPIIQMGLFMDKDGIPLAFSLFPGNQNEQKSLKPLEKKLFDEFGKTKFIYCSDAGLASEDIRYFNHLGERSFIVTQSLKKLKEEYREIALDPGNYRRMSDNMPVDISNPAVFEDKDAVYYKETPYDGKKVDQNLIITYSPKYAIYQKTLRAAQIERAKNMVQNGTIKKERRNPNDPARFVGRISVTDEGEVADTKYFIDEQKILEEAKYDGFYAVCTDLLDDPVQDILKISEQRWQIEECFRIMKTEFEARPVYLSREDRIEAHFLICFLALTIYRYLEKSLDHKYTCNQILNTLRDMQFIDVKEQGFIPGYTRTELTDKLHDTGGFRTDWEFISKSKMKTIEKLSKGKK